MNALDDNRGAGRNGGRRVHAELRVGDVVGARTVTKTYPRGYRGRSDERVDWRCICGATGTGWVFNLRKLSDTCCHARLRVAT